MTEEPSQLRALAGRNVDVETIIRCHPLGPCRGGVEFSVGF